LQEIGEETDLNQEWQNLKQITLEAASEFKISKDAKNTNHWWDDECKRAIQEKNEARKKCLIRTRTNLDNYQQK
jgi:signal recognition particle subunit SEC65